MLGSNPDEKAEAGASNGTRKALAPADVSESESVTVPGAESVTGRLVLSIFPGLDSLGRGFELEGFCVVKGPDPMLGGDIRQFHPPAGVFAGVVGGPPCQAFSSANRNVTDQALRIGNEMLSEFCRVVSVTRPAWFICENVPGVPDLKIEGYSIQRIDLRDWECGGNQERLRHIQFGSPLGEVIRPEREETRPWFTEPTCTNSSHTVTELAKLQGIAEPILPYFSRAGAAQALANAVPLTMARALARAVTARGKPTGSDCACGCGRSVTGRQKTASDACRKRLSRARKGNHPGQSRNIELTEPLL